VNYILRLAGVLAIVPIFIDPYFPTSFFTFFLASLEVLRRTLWNVFRLDYKHVHDITVQKAMYRYEAVNMLSLLSSDEKPMKPTKSTTAAMATPTGESRVTIDHNVLSAGEHDVITGFVI